MKSAFSERFFEVTCAHRFEIRARTDQIFLCQSDVATAWTWTPLFKPGLRLSACTAKVVQAVGPQAPGGLRLPTLTAAMAIDVANRVMLVRQEA
ncbi:MAG: hypothetical protein JNL45_15245 [Hyphomicrobium sp.]|jgi:hypothetical protein|nr:hypothetical protein [Hyphomicrobium sp.]